MNEQNYQTFSEERGYYRNRAFDYRSNYRDSYDQNSKVEAERLERVAAKVIAEAMTRAVVRKCWMCRRRFVKNGGCNQVTCVCGAVTCWDCGQACMGQGHHQCAEYPRSNSYYADAKRAAHYAKKNLLRKHPSLRFKYDPSRLIKAKTKRRRR